MKSVRWSMMVLVSIFVGSVLTIVLLPILSSAQSFQTAELDVDLTRSYTLVWTDSGSGAAANVSFWRPEPPAGWFRVGHHIQRGHGNPTGSTIVVRERVSGALALPLDYILVWDDTGSGAARDASVWRPACPGGYRSMGDLTNNSHTKPSLNEVACVRETALAAAFSGNEIWNDTGSGAARDFAAWEITSPAADANFTYASSGLFFGTASHDRPQSSGFGGIWAVRLPKASGGTVPLGTTTASSADQQFWDAIKNSSSAQDFQSYLSAFPSGQFAPLARFKMGQLAPANSGNPSGGGSPGAGTADQQFWDSVKNSQNAADFQGYLNAFPNGQFAALARFKMGQLSPGNASGGNFGTQGPDERFWESVKNSQRVSDFQGYLNAFPNGQFAALARFKIGQLSPANPGSFGGGTSLNAAFLNNSAAQSRATLPITLGQIQLFDAVSHCQSGCQIADNTESVTVRARTPNLSRQNTNIRQIDQALRPVLSKSYCGTPEQKRNVPMGVDVDDMFNQKIGNFFITSGDCGGNAGNVRGTASVTGFQQVIAAAQPGSLSEIARARSFFIVSNDFSVKSKISAAITKALPQMSAATSEQSADFLIGFELTDRTTGLVTANDPANANLKGELIVFTLIPAQNGRPESVRILFRVAKERGFGVFSATPDENAAKEFAKQFAKVII